MDQLDHYFWRYKYRKNIDSGISVPVPISVTNTKPAVGKYLKKGGVSSSPIIHSSGYKTKSRILTWSGSEDKRRELETAKERLKNTKGFRTTKLDKPTTVDKNSERVSKNMENTSLMAKNNKETTIVNRNWSC